MINPTLKQHKELRHLQKRLPQWIIAGSVIGIVSLIWVMVGMVIGMAIYNYL